MSDTPAPVRLEYRRSRNEPTATAELLDEGITLAPEDAPRRLVPYGNIVSVRLSETSVRGMPDRFTCSVELRSGEILLFDSIAYVSFFSAYKPTAYRPFVEELHARLLVGKYRVTYMAGDKTGRFALHVLLTIGVGFVGMVSVIMQISKPWWRPLTTALVFGGVLFAQIRHLRVNETRQYDPHALPQELLPE